ncbi:Choline/Carnitine o-acyltransferase-domain-containing protein [Amylocarpus encephaloides]|uniref:Choline/Carnitine o-acyltransferase-domain-containing protein n=1 Tax=Amylocarpus encephaloides TaxID=45428 RepID=A0A9P8C329_9HELO|nr:Choline/Carnitine o-acyltransferase-domain-containing protein [Amylocarpus encephaloides]
MPHAAQGVFQNGNDGPDPMVIPRGQKLQGIPNNASTTPITYASSLFHDVRRPVKMIVATPADISSLCFVDDEAVKFPLSPDEVEIRALAYALDKIDANVMLGISGESTSIGECAGVITALGSDIKHSFQIGDRVCCWNTNVAFASQTRVKGSFTQRIPKSWSIERGAALPQNLSLAYYSLNDCAQVQSGQIVLVHGADEPLGQATILVANLLGLQVIATVKEEAEKQTLLSYRCIKPAHVLNSEDIALPKALLRLTRGAGLDAVVNASSTSLPEKLMTSVAPFGTIVDMYGHGWLLATSDSAIRQISFDAAQLLRYRPSVASNAFQTVLSLLRDENPDDFFPIATVAIANAESACKVVQSQARGGKMVLLADENIMVNVKEHATPTKALANVERLIQVVTDLSIPHEQKTHLLGLVTQSAVGSDASLATTKRGTSSSSSSSSSSSTAAASDTSVATATDDAPPSVSQEELSVQRRLAASSSMSEVRQIIFVEQLKKIASLVAINADQLDPRDPLVDLGLDSMTMIELKEWFGNTLGANIGTQNILDAEGLEALASLVAQKSNFCPNGLPDELESATEPSPLKPAEAEGNDVVASNSVVKSISTAFVPNTLPRFPLPDINALCNAFLTGVKAFATPSEFSNTIHAVEEFKRPNGPGRVLYDRAAVRAADPNVENWEWELQLQRGFLDRRVPLTPCTSFWFSHPLSQRQHSQPERAALLTYTANKFKLKMEAGLVKPIVLNEQELTTAFHPWIFNTVRVPGVDSDEMQRHPHNNYCVVFWKGHAFKLNLSVGNQPATCEELFAAFELILSQSVTRSFVTIFTSDNRPSWAEARKCLQQLDPQNAASIATIEAAAFSVSLDEASPTTAAGRGRQFHFGGESDAANRWHDKSLQFAVCSNGVSGTIGEHTMLDAMTMSELSEAIAAAISSDAHTEVGAMPVTATIKPEPLTLRTDARLEKHIDRVRAQYANSIKDAEHAYFLFEGYGSKSLRDLKLPPKSVFQMIVQLAAYSTFGYTPPCWETVNQAHYHLGRVDIIQVVNPQVAAFLAAARDPSVDMFERRALLINATRAHVASINRAGRNLGWERNMTALRALLKDGEEVPTLYEDPVYKRVRPRVMMSNCFETGMLEKGCMWKAPEAVWAHYEVYDESVYFSIVTSENGRATRFCEHLEEAAELVKQIVFA